MQQTHRAGNTPKGFLRPTTCGSSGRAPEQPARGPAGVTRLTWRTVGGLSQSGASRQHGDGTHLPRATAGRLHRGAGACACPGVPCCLLSSSPEASVRTPRGGWRECLTRNGITKSLLKRAEASQSASPEAASCQSCQSSFVTLTPSRQNDKLQGVRCDGAPSFKVICFGISAALWLTTCTLRTPGEGGRRYGMQQLEVQQRSKPAAPCARSSVESCTT